MKTLKRILTVGLAALTLLTALTACAKQESDNASSSTGDAALSLSGVVNTDGSTSMEKVVKALAEAFSEANAGVTVNYSGTGSGSGIEAAVSGTADIGLSSRTLKDSEAESGAVAHVVALDGVAVIVHPDNPVQNLTAEQIAAIFTGAVTNWAKVGGEDLAIAVYGREAGSGTRGAFEEILGIEDACNYTNEYSSTGDVIGSVAGNVNAIGYASLASVTKTVKSVSVDGVACSTQAIQDGSYAIQRPFVMVTKQGAVLSDAAQAFLDYAMSPDAAEIISIAGAVSANG